MLALALNGWSASSRAPGGRIATVVRDVIPPGTPLYAATARLGGWQAAKARRWLKARQDASEGLLLVGKSLGGWQLIVQVVNRLPRLNYRRIALVTVDPCHPRLWDWAPDRSGDTLVLHSGRIGIGENLISRPGSRPRGAYVDHLKLVDCNRTIDADHFDIVRHPETRRTLEEAVRWVA